MSISSGTFTPGSITLIGAIDRITFALDDAGSRAAVLAMQTGFHAGRRVMGVEYDVSSPEPTITIRLEPMP